MAGFRFRDASIIPGFRLTFGFTVFYLSLIVLIPIVGLYIKTFELDWERFSAIVTGPRFMAALKLSFGASLLAALFNVVIGVMIAWVLVRYRFFARRLLDAIVDLPFALPTAVAGIALTALYVPQGWFGQLFSPFGGNARSGPADHDPAHHPAAVDTGNPHRLRARIRPGRGRIRIGDLHRR
jgi:sulfate transport system permease protein